MKVEILGCSGGIGAGLQTTSLLIDSDILIDAGTGVGSLSQERLNGIHHLFLTHSHLDHILSLPLMADNYFDHPGEPLVVYALPQTIEVLKMHLFNWKVWPDFTQLPTADAPVVRFQPMQPGEERVIGGRTIQMIPANHVVPAVGYHLASTTGSLAFTGDTTTNDTFWAFLNQQEPVDQLLVECSFVNEDREITEAAKHYDPELLAEDLKKLDYQTQVRLTHLKPGQEALILQQCADALHEIDFEPLSHGEILEI